MTGRAIAHMRGTSETSATCRGICSSSLRGSENVSVCILWRLLYALSRVCPGVVLCAQAIFHVALFLILFFYFAPARGPRRIFFDRSFMDSPALGQRPAESKTRAEAAARSRPLASE